MHGYLKDFLQRNQLDRAYLEHADEWFSPLLETIVQSKQQLGKERALLVGISGCQGSGKSTLADYLNEQLRHQYNFQTVQCSLDDFYLSRADRQALSKTVHPLLATRGVPGTHRTQLAIQSLQKLRNRQAAQLPLFDKSQDDISDQHQDIGAGVDIIIFEGWCLGASAQHPDQLTRPVNPLERDEDADASWRNYVNQQLKNDYATLFGLIDFMVMLKAPSFETVAGWRLEQEQKLAARLAEQDAPQASTKLMSETAINRFIQYYQRITEQLLATLPTTADIVYSLDSNRNIESCHVNSTSAESFPGPGAAVSPAR